MKSWYFEIKFHVVFCLQNGGVVNTLKGCVFRFITLFLDDFMSFMWDMFKGITTKYDH